MAWWPLAAAVCWCGLMWLIDWRAELRYRRLWEQYAPRIPPPAEITRAPPLAEQAVARVFFLYHLPAIVLIVGLAQPNPGTTFRWFQAAIIGTAGLLYAGLLTLLA
jgi:hypothetical protein